ncbi:MAG: tetratricopeptide repeat protein, partial [Bdellovibrionales bacterium]|nr:tetratricopeptide repeat protein [Bdellovibrionales bacterium]NQZ18082.1 tetratricopeptide repeat protein [Bdellovibrionales bacterium]
MKPINSLLFSILMISSSSALAEKMDLETHDIVINKLEAVINEKPQPSIDNSPIMIRLADLYAERARLKSLSEGDQDCNNCLKSNEDRTKALNFYDKAFKFTDSQTQGSVLMQMAHLNQILGRQKSSMNLFEKIIKNRKRYSAKTVGQAHAGLGEVYFKKGQFKKASELYQKAINISATPKKPFLKYRLAWSLRNSGKPIPATITLKALLTSRKSLENAKDTGLDKAFWADGAQDLASFMAHQNVTRKQIAELQSLSPEEQKWSNVYALGKELDRLGKKKQSLIVWDVYMLNPKVSTQEKLEIQIRSAQAYFDLNQKTKAVELHKKTLTDWQNLDCDDDDEIVCADIKTRLRNFVTLWNKAEGPKPTQQLLKAYINYLKVFGDDLQMGYWAAGIARKIKNNFVAIGLYKETAYLAKSQKNEKILNGSLMAEIQIAELTKNLDKKEAAYKRYLELKPNGPKAAEMKYQLTQVSYDRKQYAKSAEEFKALADNKKMSGAFAVKAADLAIDSLALLKDDQRIQAWTTELAKKYPQRRKEFNKIHRQSVLNEVDTRSSTKKVENSALGMM